MILKAKTCLNKIRGNISDFQRRINNRFYALNHSENYIDDMNSKLSNVIKEAVGSAIKKE